MKNTPGARGELTDANASTMEPNIIQALDNITGSLTKVINTKITTVLDAIKEQTSKIQAVDTRIEEPEKGIVDVEETVVASKARIASLEKQVCNMPEHIHDLYNQGHGCNVGVIGLPEDSEGKDPV